MHVGLHAEWLTIPPDGKDLYVAVAGKDVTVVDNKTMQVVASIPVGAVPKRNTSGLLNEVTGNGIILRVQGKKITFAISCGTTAGLFHPSKVGSSTRVGLGQRKNNQRRRLDEVLAFIAAFPQAPLA